MFACIHAAAVLVKPSLDLLCFFPDCLESGCPCVICQIFERLSEKYAESGMDTLSLHMERYILCLKIENAHCQSTRILSSSFSHLLRVSMSCFPSVLLTVADDNANMLQCRD